jgi:hypothetical protein
MGSAAPVAVLVKYRARQCGQWAVLPVHHGFVSLLPARLMLFTGLGFVLAGSP